LFSAEIMPRPYDNDLRRTLLTAYASGRGTQAELALLFGVSVSWVEKVCRQQRQTGQMDRVEQRHGPLSRVDAAAKACLLKAIDERPDLTLAELQKILAEQQGVRLCVAQVFNVLKQLKVRLKKSRFTPPSGTLKPTAASAKSLSIASARRRRNT
jgi:transposase